MAEAADPVTAAIESSIASLSEGGEDAAGSAEDTSIDSGGDESTDSATADTGSTGAEEDEGVAEERADGSDTEAAGEPPAEPRREKRKVMPWEEHDKTLKKVRREYEEQIGKLSKEVEGLAWAKDPETRARIQALDMAETNPDQFARILVQDTRIAQSLRNALGLTKAEAKEAASEIRKSASDRPKPNQRAQTEQGEVEYYDHEGLQALLDWHGQNVEGRVVEALKSQIDERLGPIEAERQAQVIWTDAVSRNKAKLDHARDHWKNFREHEDKIREKFLADKSLTLEDAYRTVMDDAHEAALKELQTKAQTSRDALRKELLAELQSKPSAAADRVEAAPAGRSSGTDDVEAVIRQSIRKAGLK